MRRQSARCRSTTARSSGRSWLGWAATSRCRGWGRWRRCCGCAARAGSRLSSPPAKAIWTTMAPCASSWTAVSICCAASWYQSRRFIARAIRPSPFTAGEHIRRGCPRQAQTRPRVFRASHPIRRALDGRPYSDVVAHPRSASPRCRCATALAAGTRPSAVIIDALLAKDLTLIRRGAMRAGDLTPSSPQLPTRGHGTPLLTAPMSLCHGAGSQYSARLRHHRGTVQERLDSDSTRREAMLAQASSARGT